MHDLRGRLVWRSEARRHPAGPAELTWRGITRSGDPAASGAYVYRLIVDGRTAGGGKLILAK